jgi:hypothetical protein
MNALCKEVRRLPPNQKMIWRKSLLMTQVINKKPEAGEDFRFQLFKLLFLMK